MGMNPVLVISLLIAFLVVAAFGAGAALFVVRGRSGADDATVQRLAAELAERQQAQVDGVVERVVSVAGESFDSRLQTGTAELEHRRQAIDERLEGVVKSLAEKVESVDRLVAERVGGMSETVGERVGGMSKSLGHQVTTMNTELAQLRGLVGQLQKERAQQHGQFVESLENATRQQQLLAETTQHLREALASPQARGQWGERMAEDVLRTAGMREGINYRKQRAIEGGTRPDFTFLLPDDQHLHMDVKFPVANYLRYLEAATDGEAVELRDRFLRDVRDRVKELHGRGYAATDTTVGYLLLFIPNESVYGFIHEHDASLLDDALGKKVVLCSPTTLFAVLGVVRQAMDTFAVERKTDEILDALAGFGEQWKKYSEQVDKVEKHLGTLSNSVRDLTGARRNQLEKQLDKIDTIRSRSVDDAIGDGAESTGDRGDGSVPELSAPEHDAPFLRDVTDRSAS